MSSTTCRRCGRPLKQLKYIELGIGPICVKKEKTDLESKQSEEGHQYYLNEPNDQKIIMKRIDGNPFVNLKQLHRHHSPTGFEWGYGGSGPADLALNILHHFIGVQNSEVPMVKCWDGSMVSEQAWDLHHDFKHNVIGAIPKEGQELSVEYIKQWIEQESVQKRIV